MKDNSKSGLKIKQLIFMLPALIILTLSTQIFTINKINLEGQIAKLNIQEEATQVAKVTSRSSEERKVEENKEMTENESITEQNKKDENKAEIKQEEQDEEIQESKYITIDQIKISKDMDLTKTCGISKEDFKKLMANLKVDTSGFFNKNSETIYDLCQKYELNEIFFCGLIAAESGWNIASNHRNTNNYISMMSKGKLIRYSSPKEGLEAAAKLLHNNYLTKGGSCYYGKTLSSVQKRFCPNSSTWVGLVYGCMKQTLK